MMGQKTFNQDYPRQSRGKFLRLIPNFMVQKILIQQILARIRHYLCLIQRFLAELGFTNGTNQESAPSWATFFKERFLVKKKKKKNCPLKNVLNTNDLAQLTFCQVNAKGQLNEVNAVNYRSVCFCSLKFCNGQITHQKNWCYFFKLPGKFC